MAPPPAGVVVVDVDVLLPEFPEDVVVIGLKNAAIPGVPEEGASGVVAGVHGSSGVVVAVAVVLLPGFPEDVVVIGLKNVSIPGVPEE